MKFLGSATITGKNQITVPKQVVEELKLKQGEQVIFLKDKNGFVYVVTEVNLPEKE